MDLNKDGDTGDVDELISQLLFEAADVQLLSQLLEAVEVFLFGCCCCSLTAVAVVVVVVLDGSYWPFSGQPGHRPRRDLHRYCSQ